MKRQILIIGQGNIGTFIGLALSQCADYDVCHFVRNKGLKPTNIILNFTDRRKTKSKIKKNSVYYYRQTDNEIDITNASFIFVSVRFSQWKIH
jgi:ketopantoate reductase